MGRLPHCRVIHLEIAADGAHHNLSRVQTHSYLNGYPLAPSDSLGVTLYRLLHLERRIARAHRVIFMGKRRTEQSHDAVPHDLIDGAFITMDRVDHMLKDGIEKLPRFLRITVGQQLHRTLDVSKKNRDVFALAFERAFGSENLLGQMLRCVRLKGDDIRCDGLTERRSTLAAEFVGRGICSFTGRTYPF